MGTLKKKKPQKKRMTQVKKNLPALPKAGPQKWVPPFPIPEKRKEATPPEPAKPIEAKPNYILPAPPVNEAEIQAFQVKKAEQALKVEKKTDYPKGLQERKEFMKVFRTLTYRWRSWDVWSDFVTMTACALSNIVDETHFEEREATYMRIINKYNKEEKELFPELFALLVLALEENPEQDFLGDIYTELGLNSKEHRQIFTPYHVAHLMAEVTVGDVEEQIKENGVITIHDCCCGGGVTLIAAANVVKERLHDTGLIFQNHLLVTGQDIDYVVAMMCYIQLSLLGVAGYFKVGNSITEPMSNDDNLDNYWFTPMYYSTVWYYRRVFRLLDKLFQTVREQKALEENNSRSEK